MRSRLEDGMWQSLASTPPAGTFSGEMVEGLPAAAKRYLLHAIQQGTPLSGSVRLRMTGRMRLKPGAPCYKMEAVQVLAASGGFIWKARVRKGLIRFSGADHYFKGEAGLHFRLWGILPVVNASGPDIARSAAGRLAIEYIWLPHAYLPVNGAAWEEVDDSRARVTVTIGQCSETVTLCVNSDGSLQRVDMMRWGNRTEDGEYTRIPFAGCIEEERTFGGYTIPSRVRVGWNPDTDNYFEFFQAEINEAGY